MESKPEMPDKPIEEIPTLPEPVEQAVSTEQWRYTFEDEIAVLGPLQKPSKLSKNPYNPRI